MNTSFQWGIVEEMARSSVSRYDLWAQIITKIGAKSICEIGVWRGEFAQKMLESCTDISQYCMIDPWTHLPNWNKPFNVESSVFDEIYIEALNRISMYAHKVLILRGTTKEKALYIKDDSLDFVYIDGDHTLRGITIDLQRILPKVKIGGIIGGDDFVESVWQHDERYEPTMICPYVVYFAEANGFPVAALPFNQFAIQKTSEDSFGFLDLSGEYSNISLKKMLTNKI